MTATHDARIAGGCDWGGCDWGDCDREAVSLRYDDRRDALLPVCRRHILVYRISSGLWQAEDEFAHLRFCRRSRFRWLARRRLLADQRAAMRGRLSRGQYRRWLREWDEWIKGEVEAETEKWLVRQ